MRYNTPIIFVKSGRKEYDPDNGIWNEEKSIREKKYANVTHMNSERQKAVFGDVKPNRYAIRLQRAFDRPYDYIEMEGKAYTVDTDRYPTDRCSFVVTENGGN